MKFAVKLSSTLGNVIIFLFVYTLFLLKFSISGLNQIFTSSVSCKRVMGLYCGRID